MTFRSHLVILLCMFVGVVSSAQGQEVPPVKVDPSASTPPEPADPASERTQSAVDRARAQLAELQTAVDEEARRRGTEIAARSKENSELASREDELRKQLRQIYESRVELENELVDLSREARQLQDQKSALTNEIRSQAQALRERFEGSLFATETPELGTRTKEILDDREAAAPLQLDRLLGLFQLCLDNADTASTFPADIQLGDMQGTIDEVDVLRVGFLGGYYHHRSSGETGFLLPSGQTEQLAGRTEGLTDSQSANLAALVSDPARGGLVPVDVTGGAGLASLQAKDSFQTWFEKGGVFMWALVAVAAFAALLILERCVVLAWRTLGMNRQINKVVKLVEAGKIDDAIRYCEKIGGAAGGVMSAALVHHERDRSVLEDAVQEALLHHAPLFQARLSFIALCAAISPLMGLLGTVTGMITTFKMVTLFGTSDPRFMAGGISEALITTQGGLYLAIPCLLFRGGLGAVAEGALGKLEAGAMSVVLALLNQRTDGGPSEAGGAGPQTRSDLASADPGKSDAGSPHLGGSGADRSGSRVAPSVEEGAERGGLSGISDSSPDPRAGRFVPTRVQAETSGAALSDDGVDFDLDLLEEEKPA